jgi:type I restriction enzyme R subunit
MYRHLQPAVDRFVALEPEAQDAFRVALGAYVRLYSFMAQILPFTDPDLEKLYTYGRFLELKLPQDPKKNPLKLDGEAVLAAYRLDKIHEGSIELHAGEHAAIYGPTGEGGLRRAEPEQVKLSQVIDVLNERFGTNFTQADQLFFDQVVAQAKTDGEVVQRAEANPFDNFALALRARLKDLMIDRMDQNADIVSRYLNEREFEEVAFAEMAKRIYEEIRGAVGGSGPGAIPSR